MFSLPVAVGILRVVPKRQFFRLYSLVFFMLFTWVTLTGFGKLEDRRIVEGISYGFLLLSL